MPNADKPLEGSGAAYSPTDETDRRMAMLLQSVAEKIEYGLLMTERAKDSCNFSGGLYYHAIGMMNVFYAIVGELKDNIGNNKDPILSPVVRSWVTANMTALNNFFGKARNIATHQGEIETSNHQDWINDVHNDTEYPERYAVVTVKASPIQDMRGEDFLSIARNAFQFLREGLGQIEQAYEKLGGTERLRRTPEDLTRTFANIQL
jgi:hypothetical protein